MGLLVRLMAQPTNIAATVDLMRHVWQCRDEGEATIDLSAVPDAPSRTELWIRHGTCSLEVLLHDALEKVIGRRTGHMATCL